MNSKAGGVDKPSRGSIQRQNSIVMVVGPKVIMNTSNNDNENRYSMSPDPKRMSMYPNENEYIVTDPRQQMNLYNSAVAVPAASENNKSFVYAHQLSVKDFQPRTIEEDEEILEQKSGSYSESQSLRSQSDYFMNDNGSRSGSVKQNRKLDAPLLSPKSVLGEDDAHLGSVLDL
jgi:hypothetical protein